MPYKNLLLVWITIHLCLFTLSMFGVFNADLIRTDPDSFWPLEANWEENNWLNGYGMSSLIIYTILPTGIFVFYNMEELEKKLASRSGRKA